jgi:hypothetical protein
VVLRIIFRCCYSELFLFCVVLACFLLVYEVIEVTAAFLVIYPCQAELRHSLSVMSVAHKGCLCECYRIRPPDVGV